MPHHQYIDGIIYQYEMQTIWDAAQNIPPIDIPITAFNLDYDGWYNGTTPPTIQSIIDHYRRARAADLSHPIIISHNGKIMDGRHRLVKVILEEQEYVTCVVFDHIIKPDKKLSADQVPTEFYQSLKSREHFVECDLSLKP